VGSLDNLPVEWADQLAIVALPAEIDSDDAEQLRDTLLAVLNRGITILLIDMTLTTFCGVAGASAIARAHQRALASGARVLVAAPAPIVRRVLAIAGVDRLVSIYPTLAAARASARRRPG
jgi:anti-sigma B factor antagonist